MAAVGVWEQAKAVQSGMANNIGTAIETVSLVAGRSCN
jgi:hypothetical protein